MSNRTIILTQKQLDEIIGGGNSPYFDNAQVPNNSINISTNGNDDETTQTSDYYSKDMPRGSWYFGRMGINTIHEENKNLKNKIFGSTYGSEGKKYSNTKTTLSRAKKAKETMMTGATQEIKNKAAKTYNTMQNNNDVDLNILDNQYKAAKNIDKNIRNNKVKNGERVLKSTTKESGNGKAHSIKQTNNGFITYK